MESNNYNEGDLHHTNTDDSNYYDKYYFFTTGNPYIFLGIQVLMIIAMWKIFKKAGEKSWKSLIPLYNTYILFKISWEAKYYLIQILLTSLMLVSFIVTKNFTFSYILGIFIASAYIYYISIRQEYLLARSFGYGVGFTFGLVLLGPIFHLILAFSSSAKYLGNGHEVNENRKKGIDPNNTDSQIV